MAEEQQTFSMDESSPQDGELTSEEMDSLKVGEEMEVQQENLLAGKYKNAEELEKAHIELQKKLGENKPEDNAQEETTEATDSNKTEEKTEDESSEETPSILDKLWGEKDKGFSDETLKELAKTNPGELAKQYLQYRTQTSQPKGLSESDVTELKGAIGGEEEYNRLIGWADQNMPKQEQEMYDAIIDRGDKLACWFAIQYAHSKYKDAVGTDGSLITGKPPSQSGDTYRSQAELVNAMADPRYDNDPAYRQDVIDKLERSKVDF